MSRDAVNDSQSTGESVTPPHPPLTPKRKGMGISSDWLWLVNQTFTKLDMVYSDFLWSPPDMVLVLILDSQKYGHHQIYLDY